MFFKEKRIISIIAALSLLVACGYEGGEAVLPSADTSNTIYEKKYDYSHEILYNPLIGYAPAADCPEEVIDYTLVYMEVLWSRFEPEEGVFDFSYLEDEFNLAKWRSEGKNLILRFVCDVPSDEKHMDIPKWLYDKTKDGKYYDCEYGKGYCPNYENETFIEEHSKALYALSQYFAGDGFLKYVELGSLGHWGEWHINQEARLFKMPGTEIRQIYVSQYESSFSYAKLLMRRPFAELPEGAGVFNDMTGSQEDTAEWLAWIEGRETYYDSADEEGGIAGRPDIWDTAPVGGEFTSSIDMDDMMGSFARTRSLLESSHMSFIGPMVPVPGDNTSYSKQEVDKYLEYVGYRYWASELKLIKDEYGQINAFVALRNNGVAPVYFDYKPYLYVSSPAIILDENAVVYQGQTFMKYEIPIDLLTLVGDSADAVYITLPAKYFQEKGSSIYIGIEDPETNEPAILLANTTRRFGKLSLLWTNDDGAAIEASSSVSGDGSTEAASD